ncbi:MAG TPA: hypothetical protein VFZ95_01335 [Steroidobacteraceae bacterium]
MATNSSMPALRHALNFGIYGPLFGAAAYWLKSRASMASLPALARAALMSLVGAAACVSFGVCLGASVSDMVSREILAMFAFPGAVAAAACTALADRAARRAIRH